MSTPNGYNNPAYCHQYDSSLYDYQYVPEIDPDSPDLEEESNRRYNQTKLVHPSFANFQTRFPDSEEGSDESNGSIIIEECNNRRVTMICEKRNKTERSKEEYYEDENFRGAYYQDISLESENGIDEDDGSSKMTNPHENRNEGKKSLRHQRPLDPPVEQKRIENGRRCSGISNAAPRQGSTSGFKHSTTSINNHGHQRYHRYEEIPSDEEYSPKNFTPPASVHRYAEIVSDENGYPSLKQEIQVEKPWESNSFNSRMKENYPPKPFSKPRAISPINYPTKSFSTPPTPTRTYPTNHYSRELDLSPSQLSPNSSGPILCSSSPIKTNSFEMSELSPPRSLDNSRYASNDQTFFIRGSSKRQPPIGASAMNDLQERYPANGKCILPLNLQKFSTKTGKGSHSVPNSPKRRSDFAHITSSSPSKPSPDRKITHILHLKPVKSDQGKLKTNSRRQIHSEKKANPARRNISNSFTDPPKEPVTTPKRESARSPTMTTRSPYKPTTVEIIPPKTAIITPIFQRKNKEQNDLDFSPRRNFEKVSHAFQSTGNIFRNTREQIYSTESEFQPTVTRDRMITPARIKRNQSVPNFTQTLAAEKGTFNISPQEIKKYSRNLDLQYSPKKPSEHFSSIDKSRISLIDQTRSSWSNADSDYQRQCSTCFIFAAIIHLVTAAATCAISFYLLSKVGRRYYLDFGLLAGFVNFILGLLGFRSYCWRWLPNRNYVSGFIGLAAFSVFTCAGLSYLITAKPMAGDPILDIMGGAICAVSVLTILLALTGLTMSGCCKAPPPDNRVTDI